MRQPLDYTTPPLKVAEYDPSLITSRLHRQVKNPAIQECYTVLLFTLSSVRMFVKSSFVLSYSVIGQREYFSCGVHTSQITNLLLARENTLVLVFIPPR